MVFFGHMAYGATARLNFSGIIPRRFVQIAVFVFPFLKILSYLYCLLCCVCFVQMNQPLGENE